MAEQTRGKNPNIKVVCKGCLRKTSLSARGQAPGRSGEIFVKFIVNEDGTTSRHEVVKGVSADLDEEALRITRLLNKWKPGMQHGRAVKSIFVLPIAFKLER